MLNSTYRPEEKEDVLFAEETDKEQQLIIYNDDINTFDWVIESLVSICRHDRIQSEQCSLIIHTVGRCSVKEGTFQKLRPMCEALLERGLSATIE